MKVFKVVRFEEVERWTFDGWEYVMVVSQSRAQTIPCSTPVVPHACTNGGYSSGVQYQSRDEVVQVHEALFVLSKDADVLSREEAFATERDAALRASKAAQEQLAAVTKRAEAAEANYFDYQKRYDDMHQKYYGEVAKNRKLEGDLGKVRTAFGTKAFEEALK